LIIFKILAVSNITVKSKKNIPMKQNGKDGELSSMVFTLYFAKTNSRETIPKPVLFMHDTYW
jgi:hypothetical protein